MKVGFDFDVTDHWKIGADIVAASGQTIFGNENGAVPQLPGYAVFGAHMSYQVSKQLQVYGLVQNIFNQHYYTYRWPVRYVARCPTRRLISRTRAALAPRRPSRSMPG